MHNHEIFYNKILRDFRGIAVFVCDGLLRRTRSARTLLCIGSVHLFVCLSVCLWPIKMHTQKRDFLKISNFEELWFY